MNGEDREPRVAALSACETKREKGTKEMNSNPESRFSVFAVYILCVLAFDGTRRAKGK